MYFTKNNNNIEEKKDGEVQNYLNACAQKGSCVGDIAKRGTREWCLLLWRFAGSMRELARSIFGMLLRGPLETGMYARRIGVCGYATLSADAWYLWVSMKRWRRRIRVSF